ncbi:MAG: pentapeptide repeat-containing protein [Asticcacaulis sp.]|nr:pentapeptide repeat-containing protein [Asticcacaulis sp.]
MMTMPAYANPDLAARHAAWWQEWRAADYSWDGLSGDGLSGDGLAGKTVLAHATVARPAYDISLKDYWAGEAGRLIPEPGTGRQWTRLHCPFHFADGTPSPKAAWTDADWQALAADVAALAAAHGGVWLLAGGVIDPAVLPRQPAAAIVADAAYVTGTVHLADQAACQLAGAWVCGGIETETGANLDRLRASGLSESDLAGIGEAEIALLDLAGAQVCGSLQLRGVRFSGPVGLSESVVIGDADFRNGTFSARSDFRGARFAGTADFSEAAFSQHAEFVGASFGGPADFFGVRFIGRALFDAVQCLDDIGFYKAAFVRRLSMTDAVVYGRLNLEGIGRLNLEGITDGDPIAQAPQAIHLVAARDGAATSLSGTLDASAGPPASSFRSLPKLLARRAVFHEDANISNRDLLSPSTFERARFHNRARFHGSDIHASVNLHATRFIDALRFRPSRPPAYPDALLRLRFLADANAAGFAAWRKAYIKSRVERRRVDYTPDGYFDGLEASFRTLKQMMEDRRDRVREGEFFNLELRARRRRSDVPWWERIASWIYWLISDYGNSIFRPLIVMAALYAGLAAAYYALGQAHGVAVPGDHLVSAFTFSLQNVFAPFSVLDAGKFSAADRWTSALVFSGDPGFSLLVRTIAAFQSLLSLLLAFLAGLAGRRRFQIN